MFLHRQLFFKSDSSGLECKGVLFLYFSWCMICSIYNSTCYLFVQKKKKNATLLPPKIKVDFNFFIHWDNLAKKMIKYAFYLKFVLSLIHNYFYLTFLPYNKVSKKLSPPIKPGGLELIHRTYRGNERNCFEWRNEARTFDQH
jgi:hypothetical protein